jgi:hypothetical protein
LCRSCRPSLSRRPDSAPNGCRQSRLCRAKFHIAPRSGAFKRFRHLEKYTSVKCCVLDEPFCQLCRASACSSQSLLANWASIKVLLRPGLLKYLLIDPGQCPGARSRLTWVRPRRGLFFALGEKGTFALCKAKEDRIAPCNEKVSLPPAYRYAGPATVLAGLFLWSAAVGTGFFGGCLIRLRLASL